MALAEACLDGACLCFAGLHTLKIYQPHSSHQKVTQQHWLQVHGCVSVLKHYWRTSLSPLAPPATGIPSPKSSGAATSTSNKASTPQQR